MASHEDTINQSDSIEQEQESLIVTPLTLDIRNINVNLYDEEDPMNVLLSAHQDTNYLARNDRTRNTFHCEEKERNLNTENGLLQIREIDEQNYQETA